MQSPQAMASQAESGQSRAGRPAPAPRRQAVPAGAARQSPARRSRRRGRARRHRGALPRWPGSGNGAPGLVILEDVALEVHLAFASPIAASSAGKYSAPLLSSRRRLPDRNSGATACAPIRARRTRWRPAALAPRLLLIDETPPAPASAPGNRQRRATRESSGWCRSRPASSDRCGSTGRTARTGPTRFNSRISTSTGGLGQHVGDRRDLFLEQRHRRGVVGRAGQLCLQVNPAIGIGRVVLDRVAEDLAVADQRQHVVGRVDRRSEQADFLHRPGDAADRHEIADLDRPQDDQEDAAGKIGEKPDQASPMATPAAAKRAAKVVVWMPK
jgi:hypothetical protein